jgi:hypothetical protein
MKRCPQGNRVETDEALKFCRVDGAALLVIPTLRQNRRLDEVSQFEKKLICEICVIGG